jgi:uncharacterized protein (DUF4415 family)
MAVDGASLGIESVDANFRKTGKGYQTRINSVLRSYVDE